MKTAAVSVRIDGIPRMQRILSATGALIRALADCPDLPAPVLAALNEIRLAMAGATGRDVGPIP